MREAKLLAEQVVADGAARPPARPGDRLLEAAKEMVAAAHGNGADSDRVDPATELASPADVVQVALDSETQSEPGARP